MQASKGKKRAVKPNRTILGRTLVLMTVCGIVAFIVLALQLFKIQILQHDHYEALAVGQQTRESEITAERGAIYDRNGKVLAMSAPVDTVFISPHEIQLYKEDLQLIARTLSDVLGVDKNDIIEKAKDTDSWYKVISKKVESDKADRIRTFINDNGLMGVHLEGDTKRYYPYSNLACHIIGFVGEDNYGLEGLEFLYNEELTGKNGRTIRLENGAGTDMLFKDFQDYYDAEDGSDLTLTIDVSIQSYVEKHLAEAVANYDLQNGAACIVMDPKTCEVLGLASLGNFDLNNYLDVSDEVKAQLAELEETDKDEYDRELAEARFRQWRDKAVSDTYEPGSVFKTITLAAALDSGAVTTADTFYCEGSMEVPGRDTLMCWASYGHGTQTLAEAAQNSCNVAFTNIGIAMGAETFWDYIGAFGFFEKTGVDLTGEADSLWWPKDVFCDRYNLSSLAAASWGQTFTVTPIQVATAMCAVCNGCYLMKPYVVKSIQDAEGNVVKVNEPAVIRQVISEETSHTVNQILESVVSEGTGKNAYVAGYGIAGKTGTSTNTVLEVSGGNSYILSFCGYAPADDPQVVVLVLLDSPGSGTDVYPSGGNMAAPVVGSIITDVLDYMGYEPRYTSEELDMIDVKVPNISGMTVEDASDVINHDGFSVSVIGEGDRVKDQLPAAHSKIAPGSEIILYTESAAPDRPTTVPDLSGMSYSTAQERLEAVGLFIASSSGATDTSTVISTQSAEPGSSVPYGSVIKVTLIDSSIQGQY